MQEEEEEDSLMVSSVGILYDLDSGHLSTMAYK